MHSAPAVSYPVGRSFFYAGLLLLMLLLAAAGLLAWAASSQAPRLVHGAAAGLWLVCALVAAVGWRRSPTGQLSWDGQRWTWSSAGRAVPVALRLIVSHPSLMLLCLQPGHGPRLWVWLARTQAPGRWLACRRAVLARQSLDPATAWTAP
jgi:hypothetical protein